MAKSNTTEIKVEWHKATEAPKKNVPIYLLFKVGKRKYPLCRLMTFHHSNVVPAECDWGKAETPGSPITYHVDVCKSDRAANY